MLVSETRPQFADDEWSQLEAILESFLAAWEESETPPALAEYLPPCGPPVPNRLVVELLKVDLEQRWQRGLRRLIEDYRHEIPDLDQRITGALIFEEYHVRRQAGDEVTPTEYFHRFPRHSGELERLFRIDPVLRSTIMVDPGSPQMLSLVPGDRIDDFDLVLRLGQGAFATVFLARQRSMQRLVAVKISADRGTEPQTLAQLDHINIVRVYDQRILPDRGLRLLYMQYAAGGTLAGVIEFVRRHPREQWNGRFYLSAIDAVLEGHGESPPADSAVRRKLAGLTWPYIVAWIGAQLAQALDLAHRQRVLHRDLKPANVLLTAEGVPKLADFNISFSANLEGSSAAADMGGSLAYMSPEQLEVCNPCTGRRADSLSGPSDLYSLGVLLWELSCGNRPFDDDMARSSWETRLSKMIERRRRGPDHSLDQLPRQSDDPGLEPVLKRCLAANPGDRFATGLELARELELCQQPAARRLISGAESGWRRSARRFPLVAVSIITVIPNLVAAIFNFIYNHGEIVARIPEAEPVFMRIQAMINLVTFPTGIMCAGWLAGSVAHAVKIDRRVVLTPGQLKAQRRRCLNLGNLAVAVGLTLWLIAAPAYPIALHWMLGEVPPAVYGHFVISLALCGLIAAAYPFFGVSYVALRAFYPPLVHWDSLAADDVATLNRLSRQCWLYLGLAASVPMIAVMILVLSGSNSRFELLALAAGGILGFGIALTAFRLVQADLATLMQLVSRED